MKKEKYDMGQCDYDGCFYHAKYPIYRLFNDGTKVWSHYCNECERKVIRSNAMIKRMNPEMKFIER